MGDSRYIIYVLINVLSGKVYVGQSYQNFNGSYSKKKSNWATKASNIHLENALLKYNGKNFVVKILDTNQTPNILNILECYYIWKFKSDDSRFGYNKTSGGQIVNEKARQKNKKKVFRIDIATFKVIDSFESYIEAQNILRQQGIKVCPIKIGAVCRDERFSHAGFGWTWNPNITVLLLIVFLLLKMPRRILGIKIFKMLDMVVL